jgi:hypothetical protein
MIDKAQIRKVVQDIIKDMFGSGELPLKNKNVSNPKQTRGNTGGIPGVRRNRPGIDVAHPGNMVQYDRFTNQHDKEKRQQRANTIHNVPTVQPTDKKVAGNHIKLRK